MVLQDLREYVGTDGPHQFGFYLDAARRVVEGAQAAYQRDVEELERAIPVFSGRGDEVPDDYSISSRVPYRRRSVARLRRARVEFSSLGSTLRLWITVRRECPPGTLFGDLLTIAVPSVFYRDSEARLLRQAERMSADLADFTRKIMGRPLSPRQIASDLGPLRVIPTVSDEDRLAAADRVANWLGHVVYPLRWSQVALGLRELAEEHKRSQDTELRSLIVARLFEVVEVAGSYALTEHKEVRRALRKELNRCVTEDVLGPGWRKPPVAEQIDAEGPPTVSPEARIGATVQVGNLAARAGLTRREAEVFATVTALGGEHGALETTAGRLKIAPATVRVLWGRAKKKLRAVGE